MAAEIAISVSADDPSIRAEDYLNDKIQTPGDLENIDSLLEDLRGQQYLLTKQVRRTSY